MAEHSCDVAVIGAGTAGLAAERAAREGGATTRLIDESFGGTVCATVGCMPSKLLIAAADAAHGVRRASIFGVEPGGVTVDGPAVMARLRKERDRFAAATRGAFDDLPAGTCLKGRARFTGPTRLELDRGDVVFARAVVVAAGAYPMVPAPFEALGDLVLTNRTVFEIADLPRSLAVIGGGAIGLELAQAMARLGVETCLFDHAETLGGSEDAEVQAALEEILGAEVTLHLGVEVEAAREGDEARLSWSGASAGEARFERVLVAAGRPPQLDGLDLVAAALALDETGLPAFDPTTLQCGDAPVFVAGDVNGDRPVLHEASDEGTRAGRNAAAWPDVTPVARSVPFRLTFTDPPFAVLGAPAAADSIVGTASYADQGRARVEARAQGLVRLYAAAPDGRLTGAELFAPGADHMAHLLVLALSRGETASALLDLPIYHPTLEEGLKPALRAICAAPQISARSSRDSGDPPGA
ncbi:dihydrolipoyl dehydrogenase [uncultured Jannaschia sp.]|uniref:dihydrolipoyl dehydrogenase n=1 Tax=uncultured Jannaschia sp. TaxID=293347 RepID=UPI00261D52DB|nr:dihydrolipoyl dehydrogenase [uncultured Jannaschia sp.]